MWVKGNNSSDGGCTPKIIAYGKWQKTISWFDSNYCSCTVVGNTHTITFLKAMTGYIGRNLGSIDNTSTADINSTATVEGNTYSDSFYEFSAGVGDTIVYNINTSGGWGYEIIGS